MTHMTRERMLGRLFLVPAPLDFGCNESSDLQDTLPLGSLKQAAGLSNWICENAKSTRAYLKRVDAVLPCAAPFNR
jgi:16S rRNA (cytidine1402-2'-O)-methyltransferase